MKKFMLLFVLMVSNLMLTFAQQDIVLHITDQPDHMVLCTENQQRVLIYPADDCNEFRWIVNDFTYWNENPMIIDYSFQGEYYDAISIYYGGCEFGYSFSIRYKDSTVPTSFTHDVWKRQGEMRELEAVGQDSISSYYFGYEYLWSTGETTRTIEVTDPGTYTCTISEICGTATRAFIVQDNVEISLSTCDLESNLNLITWPVTAAQAEYIDHVIVKRDGIEVGTANYSDGQFIDAIGSDAASRTYTLIAVATDGTECPIVSYPKETIHMSYTLGMGNTIEMGWNTPTGYDLLGYNICEWNPNDGNLSVIDFVGASVTSYTCSEAMFDHGNIVIQGVENGKTESRLLSNRSWETVGLGEQSSAAFKVYPNPSNGIFTVEGTGTLRIANVLGQEIIAKEIEGNTAIELPQGIYFVRLNGVVRKIVVE